MKNIAVTKTEHSPKNDELFFLDCQGLLFFIFFRKKNIYPPA